MPAADFLDTNILIYSATPESDHARAADAVIAAGGVVSVQVLNEFVNTMSRKYKASWSTITAFLEGVRLVLTVTPLDEATHLAALRLIDRYKLQWWDALIVASALQAGCTRLITQDMHAGLVLDGRLTIMNPFV